MTQNSPPQNTIRNFKRNMRRRGRSCLDLTGQDYLLSTHLGGKEEIKDCYASFFGNCVGPISKEHYISENILSKCDVAQASGGAFPWLKARQIPPKQVFVTKCLCVHHNSYLSPLDALAENLFEDFPHLLSKSRPIPLIWGPSLARWYLKCLVGLVCSKQIIVNERVITLADVPKDWIEILFGKKGFEPGQGLYMTPVVGTSFRPEVRIRVETLFLGDDLSGIRITLAGVEFILSMEPDPKKAFNVTHPAFSAILHSPKQIRLDQHPRVKLFW